MKRAARALVRLLVALAGLGAIVALAYAALGAWNRHRYATSEQADPGAAPRTFYVSASGSDSAAGTAPAAAWRTLARVNRTRLAPGDRVLLRGGEVFAGTLVFDDERGTPARPITVVSYGPGRATIDAGAGTAIRVHNAGGFRMANLRLAGSGRTTNRGSGIEFANDLIGGVKLPFVRIDRVEASGFGRYGVLVDGNRGKSGFRDVRITRVEAHDNALAGISVLGEFKRFSRDYAHRDVYIGESQVYRNPGVPGRKQAHSGSGIVLSDTDGGTVEHSVAWGNGWLCESEDGGPVGIWAWDANRVVIQFNESYGNRTGTFTDGGGFDLDGGVTRSVMQYNYSHDNAGAGFLLAQFPLARRFAGNTVRYNLSVDDGRANGRSGIAVWGHVTDSDLYHNTVYISAPAGGTRPRAVSVSNNEAAYFWEERGSRGVRFRNNIFQTVGGLEQLYVAPGQEDLRFQGNFYHADGGPPTWVWNDLPYGSLEVWRAASGQERLNGRPVGSVADPMLRLPAGAPRLNDTRRLTALDAYRLRPGSPAIDAGIPLRRLGVQPGARDFWGTPLPRGLPDVGADEAAPEPRVARLGGP